MTWSMVVLVLVPAVLYILGNLLGGKEEERPETRPPRQRPGQPSESRQLTPSSDIERFLEAINRRRQQAATPSGLRSPEGRSSSAAPARSVPPARPEPVAQARRQVSGIVVAEDWQRAASVQLALNVSPAADPGPVKNRSIAATIAPVVTRSATPPLLTKLAPLLRTPQTIRTAMLIQEIFGPPRCRRGPHRPGRPQG